MRDEPVVTSLVLRARDGDRQAWEALVERYAPLIGSICRGYRLGRADAEDVGQNVWLHLMDHVGRIRVPEALPGWLATTTRRECERVLRTARGPRAAWITPEADTMPDNKTAGAEEQLLAAELSAALRTALADLPSGCQQLLALLVEDAPVPYAEISTRLSIPVGSIGPNRGRCLDRIRRQPAIAALIDAEAAVAC